MGYTCRVRRVRFEADAKDIVLVISCHMKIVRVGFVMGQSNRCEMEFRNMLLFLNGEAVEFFADRREVLEVGHG